ADFTFAEALPLAAGFGRSEGARAEPRLNAQRLLRRILYWTGGHPYLTQRLCQTLAEALPRDERRTRTLVDQRVHDLFLSPQGRERDDNLLFVRERLLRTGAGYLPVGEVLASLLDLYARVRSGIRVPADDTSPLVDILRLSGI